MSTHDKPSLNTGLFKYAKILKQIALYLGDTIQLQNFQDRNPSNFIVGRIWKIEDLIYSF